MLFVMLYSKIVNQQILLTIDNVGGLHMPNSIVHKNLRVMQSHVCCLLTLICLEKLSCTVYRTLDGIRLVIVPAHACDQFVVGGIGIQGEVHRVAVVHDFT